MSVDFNREIYFLLGLPFDAVDMAGAVQLVQRAARERRTFILSTPNLNFLIGCLADDRFRDSVINSDLSIADGMPLIWMARLLGMPIRERVPGSSLFEALRRDASERLSIYFFGGADGVAETACKRLNAEVSGLTCAGFESPGYGSVEDISNDAAIANINASGADFLLVSLAARKGQAWIEHNRARISVPVISCLGATLNFAAGTVNRAPAWVQGIGLEWLWRIKEEPMLWRRYFNDGLSLLTLLATRALPYAWYMLCHRPDADQLAGTHIDAREEGRNYAIRLRGPWTQRNLAPLRECFSMAAAAGMDVTLEMSGVTYVDSAFLGLATLLQTHQTKNGRRLLIVSLPEPVRRVIEYCRARHLDSSIA